MNKGFFYVRSTGFEVCKKLTKRIVGNEENWIKMNLISFLSFFGGTSQMLVVMMRSDCDIIIFVGFLFINGKAVWAFSPTNWYVVPINVVYASHHHHKIILKRKVLTFWSYVVAFRSCDYVLHACFSLLRYLRYFSSIFGFRNLFKLWNF